MKLIPRIVSCFLAGWLLAAAPAAALNGEQIVRLKQAGVSDETLGLMIQEKCIETAALTVEDVLDMKAAGIEEETLQTVIKSYAAANTRRNKVYEVGPRGLMVGSIGDVVALKEAGLSEETIRAIVTVTSVDKNQQTYAEALRVLDHTGIWVTPRDHLPRKQPGPGRPSPHE